MSYHYKKPAKEIEKPLPWWEIEKPLPAKEISLEMLQCHVFGCGQILVCISEKSDGELTMKLAQKNKYHK